MLVDLQIKPNYSLEKYVMIFLTFQCLSRFFNGEETTQLCGPLTILKKSLIYKPYGDNNTNYPKEVVSIF
jgi:hypothetical protein